MPSVPSVTGLRQWISTKGRGLLQREPKPVVPRNILIVDSNATYRQITARQVESLGYQPIQTSTLADALNQIAEHHPEFLLLGFDLDDATGLDALAQIRELDPDLAVIMLAADLWDTRTAEAMRKGAVAYLARPFSRDDLRELFGRA